jgi:adenylate cyclase
MGDGLMAVFGSPVDIEDGPLKAVAAALRMREALAQYNIFRRADGKEALNVGIGIDTGPLVAGYMGSSKTMNYTVIGAPVNLASRLCGAAQPTEILISSGTHAALTDWLQVETKPPMALKGISEPVVPHNVSRLKKRPEWLKY